MSARAFLKQASASLHEDVDQAFSSYSLATRDGYLGFLQAHAWALSQIEPTIEQAGVDRIVPDWHARRRRHAIAEDICALEAAPPEANALAVEIDDATLWGILYVLEGSRLGARYLSRQVGNGADWQADEPPPLAYLTHGQDTALWPQFLQQLEAASAELDQERLLEGVRWCFSVFLASARKGMDRPHERP
ncbi:biliverdin-producing heme oxygenase [Pseudomonas matsuisoli]|uniref:Heme oxygenase n=1 Tax=Pseudomonas matsuisoli TaxID=1515666 RepID=A0A917PSW3_9PSED|nr:biliverdin-producing heme oxygenase [Pseudomonas matsuisoli]GGJ89881.1 hypothetical protein GCM10009304_14340 [Pseudomonas matsuisoli]